MHKIGPQSIQYQEEDEQGMWKGEGGEEEGQGRDTGGAKGSKDNGTHEKNATKEITTTMIIIITILVIPTTKTFSSYMYDVH